MNSSGLPPHCFHLAAVRTTAARNSRGWNMKTETIPQRMINAVTGESHVIQLISKEGLTAPQVAAYLAAREAEAKLINPDNCQTTCWYTKYWTPMECSMCRSDGPALGGRGSYATYPMDHGYGSS